MIHRRQEAVGRGDIQAHPYRLSAVSPETGRQLYCGPPRPNKLLKSAADYGSADDGDGERTENGRHDC
jgi:hypothetical protein